MKMSRTLIKNGIIVTLDPEIGDLPAGDVLIGNDKILAVGSNLDTGELRETIDADGMIVMPGLINAHLHTWQTALRGLGGDWAGSDYFNHLHTNLAPRFTPQDAYIGTLVGCLNQIDAGTTTLFDWCHNNSTPDHTDASVEALIDAGIRAFFGQKGTISRFSLPAAGSSARRDCCNRPRTAPSRGRTRCTKPINPGWQWPRSPAAIPGQPALKPGASYWRRLP